MRLTKEEKEIEDALLNNEFINVDELEIKNIAQYIAHRKKDKVLNIRINSGDLNSIKQKARKFGVRYQTFISEVLHKVAL